MFPLPKYLHVNLLPKQTCLQQIIWWDQFCLKHRGKNEKVHFPCQRKSKQKKSDFLFYHRKPVPRARLNRQYISIRLIIPPAISSGVRTKSASYTKVYFTESSEYGTEKIQGILKIWIPKNDQRTRMKRNFQHQNLFFVFQFLFSYRFYYSPHFLSHIGFIIPHTSPIGHKCY